MAPKVVMRGAGERVVLEQSGSLGDYFNAYRLACAGAKFDGETKTWSADAETAMRIAGKLSAAGFTVILTAEVRERLNAEVSDATASIEAAQRRLEVIDKRLAKKGRSLFGFQQLGVVWMASRKKSINCDDMGLGKTASTLCALPEPKKTGVLVVCPAVAKGVWEAETPIWRDDYRVTVLSGKKSFRWPEPGEIVVVNYDVLPATPPERPKDLELVLVADEAHYLKNYKAKRTQKVALLAERVDRRIFLTGTPLPSRPEDLWSVLQIAGVAHEAFGSWKEYCRLFSGRKNPFGGMDWGKPLPEVGERLKPVLMRRLKKDVLKDLPDKMYRVLEVEVSAEIEKKLDEEIKSLGIDVWRAREISDIPFDKMAKTRALLAKSKEDAAIEVIESFEEAGEPLVVFSAHRYVIDRLATREGWAVITGDVKPAERKEIQVRFQAGEFKGIGATIGSASTALTLTRASHALYVDLSWVPADNSQSEDRIYRIGTTRGVMITHMVSQHGLDKHVRKLIAKKMGIIEASIEKARGNKKVSIEEIRALIPKPAPVMVDDPGNPRRPARTTEEKEAAHVIMTVGGVCDGAKTADQKGFSASNQVMGRSLALELLATGRLTEPQWRSALWFRRHYSGQVAKNK